jgi:predicted nuclease of predicted toxin-antitoxin system
MPLQFHLDENVSRAVAAGLASRHVDITTSRDAQLIGASDDAQLMFAKSNDRVLVTHDDDFTRMHADNPEHSGILYCHKDKYSIGDLIRVLMKIVSELSEDDLRGHLVFL